MPSPGGRKLGSHSRATDVSKVVLDHSSPPWGALPRVSEAQAILAGELKRGRVRCGVMKNTDYLVYLITRGGSRTRFARDEEGWVQTAPSGKRRRCTAEQVLNHLLPALVLGGSVITTEVRLRRGRRFHRRIERLRSTSTPRDKRNAAASQ